MCNIYICIIVRFWGFFERNKWVSVTTTLRVLKLLREERPPGVEGTCEYTEVAVADSRQGWSSSLGVGQDANSYCVLSSG